MFCMKSCYLSCSFSLEERLLFLCGGFVGQWQAITNKTMEGLSEVGEAIRAAGSKAVARACHNGRLDEIGDLFKFVASTYGRLDILVNNAAMNFYYGGMIDAPEDAWDKTMDVNLKDNFFMCCSRDSPILSSRKLG